MKFSIRFLPVTIFVAVLLLTVRVGDIWRDVASIADAKAQQQPEQAVPAPQAQDRPPAPLVIVPDDAAAAVVESEPAPRAREATRGRPMRQLADDPTLMTQSEIDLLQQLVERRDRIEKREQEIEVRAAVLKAAETRIDKKAQEMKNLQAVIQGLLANYDEQQEKKVASLVKLYENMKPKDAARIFEELEMDVLLMVAERINTRRLAPIMSAMNPQKAREVTVELSRLRQLPEDGPGS